MVSIYYVEYIKFFVTIDYPIRRSIKPCTANIEVSHMYTFTACVEKHPRLSLCAFRYDIMIKDYTDTLTTTIAT